MTTPSNTTGISTYAEALASWNVKYRLNGFDCMLTLRGDTGKDLLEKAAAALKWLSENGAYAAGYTSKPSEASTTQNNEEHEDESYCSIHKVPMTRFEKNNRVWYSHKSADGSWCKGK
jgi:hypothetical protein